MEVTLSAVAGRLTGSRASRRLRGDSRVPAIVYGRGLDPLPVSVDHRELQAALHTDAGFNAIIYVEVEGGDTYTTLARQIQRHPYKPLISHLDFVQVSLTEKVTVDVYLEFIGEPVGVILGEGLAETIRTSVSVEALATQIPPAIEMNVESLELGDSIRVGDLPELEGVTYLDDPAQAVLTITVPRAVVEEEEVEEELEEGELPEGEEAEEGEEGEAEEESRDE